MQKYFESVDSKNFSDAPLLTQTYQIGLNYILDTGEYTENLQRGATYKMQFSARKNVQVAMISGLNNFQQATESLHSHLN